MKLIVDVPDNVYAKVTEYYEHNGIVEAVYGYIYRGIPLDKIRDEIEDYVCNHETNTDKAQGMLNALQIIDKYR